MDQSTDFLNSFRSLLESLDDDYLIGLSNKGIFKRCLKDLEKGVSVEPVFRESDVEVTVDGKDSVVIPIDINAFSCTCPSTRVCRHLIISLLHLRKNLETCVPAPREKSLENDDERFYAIKNLPVEQVQKKLGKTQFSKIASRIAYGLAVEIKEENLLTVSFPEEGTYVKFPATQSLENSICFCKQAEFCRHRAEAVLLYQAHLGLLDLDQLPRETVKPIDTTMLGQIKNLLTEGLTMGLARMTPSILEHLEQTAVEAHGADLPYLEKELRALYSDLKLHFQKNAGFDRELARKRWTTLLNLVSVLEQEPDSPIAKKVADNRSEYTQVHSLKMTGIGANPWMTKSGYIGVSFYFYSETLNRVLSFSQSRPVFYEGRSLTVPELYNAPAPWGLERSSADLSRSRLVLYHGKTNKAGRLSAGTKSRAAILGQTSAKDIEESGIVYRDWKVLLDRQQRRFDLLKSGVGPRLCFLEPARWGKSCFDAITQRFTLPLVDISDRRLVITVYYNPQNRKTIDQLEALEKSGNLPLRLFGTVALSDDGMIFFPYSVVDHKGVIKNLGLDDL